MTATAGTQGSGREEFGDGGDPEAPGEAGAVRARGRVRAHPEAYSVRASCHL